MLEHALWRTRVVAALVTVLGPLVLTAGLGASGAAAQNGREPDPAALAEMYRSGVAFGSFLEAAEARRARWESNYGDNSPPSALVDRARSLAGSYRLLVVAVDTCSDSVNTIPYLAGLVERVETLAMAIVDADAGRAVMNAYRTPDGRGATPTVVILDADNLPVGAWVERPAALQDWWLGSELSTREKVNRKQLWYDWDRGAQTVREIVELLEAADTGGR